MTDTDETPTDGPEPTDLSDRLHHLADAAISPVDLTNPAEAGHRRARFLRNNRALAPAFALGATLVLVAVAVAAVSLGGDDEPGPDVRAGEADNLDHGPQVAVTFGNGGGSGPADITLRFLDGAGNEIATRSWTEVEETLPDIPDEVFALRGLLQDVPAGDLTLEATLRLPGEDPQSCTQPFTMGEGDRLVLDLQPGPLGASFDRAAGDRLVDDETHPPEITCARAVPLADMIDGQTTPTGEAYLGSTLDEAELTADDAGLTVRLVAEDGMSLGRTEDLQPDRLDVVLWDGEIVAAELPCENPLYDCGNPCDFEGSAEAADECDSEGGGQSIAHGVGRAGEPHA